MARSTTDNLSLGVFDDDDEPGAGSKTSESGNTGINFNWLRIDNVLGAIATAAGALKDSIIDYNNLKTTVADGTTIEVAGSPAKLRLKDGGIGAAKLGADIADGSTLEQHVTTKKLNIKDGGVTGAKLKASGAGKVADLSTIQLNGSSELEVKDGGITAAKLAAGLDGYLIFGDARAAAAAPGAAPAAQTEWAETSTALVQKVSVLFRKRSTDVSLVLYGYAKTSTSKTWTVELKAGYLGSPEVAATTSGSNSAYTGMSIALDISSLPDDTLQEASVSLKAATADTATMKNVVLMVRQR